MARLHHLWVVIDTSVWVSAILTPSGPPWQVVTAFGQGRFGIVMSEFLFAELAGVLQRPRIRRRHADRDDAAQLLALLDERARRVTTTGLVRVCRDPNDDRVVETAIVGGARYVVSRDEDLTRDLEFVRTLQGYGVEVLTVARFLELLEPEPP